MASDYCLTGGSPDATTKAIINQFNIDASQKELNEYWIVSSQIFLRMDLMYMIISEKHTLTISYHTDLRRRIANHIHAISSR